MGRVVRVGFFFLETPSSAQAEGFGASRSPIDRGERVKWWGEVERGEGREGGGSVMFWNGAVVLTAKLDRSIARELRWPLTPRCLRSVGLAALYRRPLCSMARRK